jgi:phytoene dehydrogenase-like protein
MASVAIVGAGLSGLRCATLLLAAGHDVDVYERSDSVGGRMATDRVDGFLLDRGFHVMQTAYPTSQRAFDFTAMGVKAFEPGALIVQNRKNRAKVWKMADPFRRPIQGAMSGLNRFASLFDLMRVARLRFAVRRGHTDQVFDGEGKDTRSFLQKNGFSESMIDRFFHPLFSGIFLEDDLRTNERMFRFVFRMMSQGNMVLPKDGIAAAPRQLAQRIGDESIHLNCNVDIIDDTTIEVDGERKPFDAIVRAFNIDQAAEKRHVWTLHFDAETSPLRSHHVLLNADVKLNNGLIAHLAVPSDIQPAYAPVGRSLVTITVVGGRADALGLKDASSLEQAVRKEASRWFPESVNQWRTLAVQHIEHALPEVNSELSLTSEPRGQGFECGDHTLHGSVEGALRSAESVAKAVDAHLRG